MLRACLKGRLQPVMGRAWRFEECALSGAERQSLLDAFCSVAGWVRVYYLWRPNLRDEGDNHVMELAVAGSAQVMVTNNVQDFRMSDWRFSAIRILRPAELLLELI